MAQGDGQKKPDRSGRMYVLWGVGMLLALGVCWFVGAIAVPVWKVRKAVPLGTVPLYDDTGFLREIGLDWGRSFRWQDDGYWWPTAADVGVYVRMPNWVAPEKERALSLLAGKKDGVPILVHLLESPRTDLRMAAAYFLADIHPWNREAVPGLVKALRDDHYQVKCLSAYALGRIAAPEAIEPLKVVQANKNEGEFVRQAAEDALERIRAEERPE